jgi:predicted nuclease with TOPRIM domain
MKDSKFKQYKIIENLQENIFDLGCHKSMLEEELEKLEKEIAKVSKKLREAEIELIYYLKTQVDAAVMA